MPPASKVVVRLTDDQRDALGRWVRTGTHPAARRRRAAIPLRADADGPDAWTEEETAEHLETSRMAVMRVRQQFAAGGLDAALRRKKPTGRPYRELDGQQEPQLIAVACSEAPEGHARGTMASLAERLVELKVIDSIHPSAVCRALTKMNSSRGSGRSGSSRRGRAGRSSRRWET